MKRLAVIGGSLAVVACAAVIAWLQAGSGSRRAADTLTVAEATPARPTALLLFQQFEVRDLERLAQGEDPQVLEPFDAFVYGHNGTYEEIVATLVARGKPGFRYYNILTAPLPEWIGAGSPWFDWVDSVVVRQWGATIRYPDGRPARFRWFGKPVIFDWSQIGPERGRAIAVKQIELLGATRGLFLDQFWLAPATWMFDREAGDPPAWPKAREKAWETNIRSYLDQIRALAPGPVLPNGADDAPMPIYLENAQNDWAASVALWKKDPMNVLSVRLDALAYQDSLLDIWRDRGGFIAVSAGELPETQAFYQRAASFREATRPSGE